MATNLTLERIYPFFIVDNLTESIDLYNQINLNYTFEHTDL